MVFMEELCYLHRFDHYVYHTINHRELPPQIVSDTMLRDDIYIYRVVGEGWRSTVGG